MSRLSALLDERTVALLALASSIVMGLAYPPLAAVLEPVALPALFLVVVFSLVPFAPISRQELFSVNSGVLRVVAWHQLVLPLLVVAIGTLCRFPDYVVSLLIVTSCSGALFASPALAALLDLDKRRALQCMVLTTLTMPVSLYVFLTLVNIGQVHLDLKVYALRVLLFLAVPFAMFLLYRQVATKLGPHARKSIEAGSRWAVIATLAIFGIGMMSRVTNQEAIGLPQILFFFGLTTILCLGMLVLTTVVMYRFGLDNALTAAIVSGFRNVGLGYALIGDMIGPELAIYTGIGLLPVFTAPILLRLLGGRGLTQVAAPA